MQLFLGFETLEIITQNKDLYYCLVQCHYQVFHVE